MEIKKARQMAEDLIRYHRPEFRFEFDGAKRRFGRCNHDKRLISLSRALVAMNTEDQVLDTILHEIAHARAGHKAGHGEEWKATARALGCSDSRTYDSSVVVTPPKSWEGICPGCETRIMRHRRKRISCSKCGMGKFNPEFLFVWSKREISNGQ
jgi:SprT protein